MNQNIKVRLTLFVQGAQRLSSQECEENPKNSYNQEVVKLEWYNKKHKKKQELITINTRKNKLVKQVININEDSYFYMIGKESFPTLPSLIKKYPPKVWIKLGKKERLEVHLSLIAESLGAIKFNYDIIED